MPDAMLSFKRVLDDEEILFIGNTKNNVFEVDIAIPKNKKCILTNEKNCRVVENYILNRMNMRYICKLAGLL